MRPKIPSATRRHPAITIAGHSLGHPGPTLTFPSNPYFLGKPHFEGRQRFRVRKNLVQMRYGHKLYAYRMAARRSRPADWRNPSMGRGRCPHVGSGPAPRGRSGSCRLSMWNVASWPGLWQTCGAGVASRGRLPTAIWRCIRRGIPRCIRGPEVACDAPPERGGGDDRPAG